MTLKNVAFSDIGLIADVLMFGREPTIRQQQDAIRELSTPVLVRERLLLLPIIGVIDSYSARLVTESLLRATRTTRAKVVVMDITGVQTIDSKVANHLLQTVRAARLMGALVIVTGLTADMAQSLVTLGIELSNVTTVGDLQGGLEEVERLLGYPSADDSGRHSSNAAPELKPWPFRSSNRAMCSSRRFKTPSQAKISFNVAKSSRTESGDSGAEA
jgi:rsbT co-antagonist protein RsbR